METVNILAILENCRVALKQPYDEEGQTHGVDEHVRAVASGHPLPTNLG